MPGWVPAGIGLQGMLSQLTATGAPTMTTPSAPGSVPPGWEGPDPSQAAGGGFDWSWLGNLPPSPRIGPYGRPAAPPSEGGDIAFPYLSQLFAGSPTQQLAQRILDRMGVPA